MGRMLRTVVLFLVTVAAITTLHGVEGKVNYMCYFGEMRSTPPDAHGARHQFCATEMNPPFLQRGQFLVARDLKGGCYECLCEEEYGMACCQAHFWSRSS